MEVMVGAGDVVVLTIVFIERGCGRRDGIYGIFGCASGKKLFGWGGCGG